MPPCLAEEGVLRHRGVLLEELGPSSKSIVTRFYHQPKLRDWMEVTSEELVWWSSTMDSHYKHLGLGGVGNRVEGKVNHLNIVENSVSYSTQREFLPQFLPLSMTRKCDFYILTLSRAQFQHVWVSHRGGCDSSLSRWAFQHGSETWV